MAPASVGLWMDSLVFQTALGAIKAALGKDPERDQMKDETLGLDKPNPLPKSSPQRGSPEKGSPRKSNQRRGHHVPRANPPRLQYQPPLPGQRQADGDRLLG